MTAAVQISRDPFARASLMRIRVDASDRQSCAWCGQPARFRYYWEADSIQPRTPTPSVPFCSVGCYRAYFS